MPGGVGIVGGTFDPIHLAHLQAGEEVRAAERLDEIRFVPAAVPPHKQTAGITPAAHRLRMVELAVAGRPGFRAWPVELERTGPSYSVDTLRQLRREVGPDARVVFVLGRDAFADFPTWKDPADICALCDIVVLTRPAYPATLSVRDIPVAAREAFCYDSTSDTFRHESGHLVKLLGITPLDISATDIRDRVRAGRSIAHLVPAPVADYIAQHGLYRAEGGTR